MSCTPAPSTRAALHQLTELHPGRSTASDGLCGDAAHMARQSDHNPDSRGIAHAFDATQDPGHGVDFDVLAEQIRQRVVSGHERRVKYLIWSRRIFNPSISPEWRPYSGTDPHTGHLHVSILYTLAAETDTEAWWIPLPSPVPVPPPLVADVTHHLLEGKPVARILFPVTTDSHGNGGAGPDEGLDVDMAKVLSVSPQAPHDPNAGDAEYLLAPVGYHEFGGKLHLTVVGGPPNAVTYPIVLTAD